MLGYNLFGPRNWLGEHSLTGVGGSSESSYFEIHIASASPTAEALRLYREFGRHGSGVVKAENVICARGVDELSSTFLVDKSGYHGGRSSCEGVYLDVPNVRTFGQCWRVVLRLV